MRKLFASILFVLALSVRAIAAPAPIAITGTVYSVTGAPVSGARVTIVNPYTQNLSGIVEKSQTTLITNSSGVIPTTNFVQGERVRIQVDTGTAQEVVLPFAGTGDLSAILATTQNPAPTNLINSATVTGSGDYNIADTVAGSAINITPQNVFHFTLTSPSSAGSNKITNLAADTANGDALSHGVSTLNALASPTAPYAMASEPLTGLPAASASGQALAYGQNGAQLTATQPGAAVVSTSVAGAGNETSQVISAPATITNGNVLLLIGGWNSAAISGSQPGTITLPSGFTQLRYDTWSGGDQGAAGVYCKVAASEPGSYTVSWQNGQNFDGIILNVSGVTGCTADAVSGGFTTTSGGTATAAALTLAGANDFVVGVAYGDGANAGGPGILAASNSGAPYSYQSAYSRTVFASPASAFKTIGSSGNQIAQQVALFSSTTLTGAPVVQGSAAQLATLANTSVNNVINVMASPYNAANDSSTDDTTAIQTAIYAAEGATPPTFPAYLTGRTVYLPTSPVINASTGAADCYLTSKPLRVASGPIEIKGDSGTCITKDFAGPTFIAETWGTSHLIYGPGLVGTGGASISTTSSQASHGIIDLAGFLNQSQMSLADSLSQNIVFTTNGFDIEFFMEPTTTAGGGVMESMAPSFAPNSSNQMFKFFLATAGGVTATVYTTGGLVSLTTCPTQSASTAYDIALDWDKSTYRLFQNGTLCSSVSSSSPPVQSGFEEILIPDYGRFDDWMAGGIYSSPFPGYLDDIRFEQASLHTTNYTPSTTRFTPDGNTILLVDPALTDVDGTQQATTAYGGIEPVYFPMLGGGQPQVTLHLHNMELCENSGASGAFNKSDGLFAQYSNGSEFDHLKCSNAVYAGLNFYNNDFGTYEHDNTSLYGMLGILHGGAWNGSLAQNDYMDDNAVACEETVGDGGSSFHDSHQSCTNRGNLFACKMFMQVAYAGLDDYDFCDEEAGTANLIGMIYINGGVPIQIDEATFASGTGKPFIEVDSGGAGPAVINGIFLGSASYIVNYGSTPSSPMVLINPVNSGSVALSNNAGDPWVQMIADGIVSTPTLPLGTETSSFNVSWAGQGTISATLGASSLAITFQHPTKNSIDYLNLCQDSTGGRTGTTFAAGTGAGTLRWAGGSAPSLTTTANKCDRLKFAFDGTNLVGTLDAGNF